MNYATPPVSSVPVSRPLRPEGWTVRYEYKMACFAEFRGEDEVALKCVHRRLWHLASGLTVHQTLSGCIFCPLAHVFLDHDITSPHQAVG